MEFLKVGLDIEIKLVVAYPAEKTRLILDEFSHVQRCFLLFCHKKLRSVSAQCQTSLFPLPRSLQCRSSRSAAASGRSDVHTHKNVGNQDVGRKAKAAERLFSAETRPLTSIAETDAQISGGETRQDLKIPGVSPRWLLNALSVRWLPVSFRCYGRVFSFHADTPAPEPVRSSWTVCTNPRSVRLLRPFSNYLLIPTRKDTTYRHWQQPLVIDLEGLVLKLCAS